MSTSYQEFLRFDSADKLLAARISTELKFEPVTVDVIERMMCGGGSGRIMSRCAPMYSDSQCTCCRLGVKVLEDDLPVGLDAEHKWHEIATVADLAAVFHPPHADGTVSNSPDLFLMCPYELMVPRNAASMETLTDDELASFKLPTREEYNAMHLSLRSMFTPDMMFYVPRDRMQRSIFGSTIPCDVPVSEASRHSRVAGSGSGFWASVIRSSTEDFVLGFFKRYIDTIRASIIQVALGEKRSDVVTHHPYNSDLHVLMRWNDADAKLHASFITMDDFFLHYHRDNEWSTQGYNSDEEDEEDDKNDDDDDDDDDEDEDEEDDKNDDDDDDDDDEDEDDKHDGKAAAEGHAETHTSLADALYASYLQCAWRQAVLTRKRARDDGRDDEMQRRRPPPSR